MATIRRAAGPLLVLAAAVLVETSAGQPTPPGSPPAVNGGTADVPAPGVEAVQQHIDDLSRLDADGTLDDAGRVQLELYRAALAALQQAKAAAEQRAREEAEFAKAPSETESVTAELAQPTEEPLPQPPPDATVAQLQQGLEQAQADLAASRAKLADLDGEPARRQERRAQIPRQIAEAQQSLEEREKELASLPLPDESPALTEARRTKLAAEAAMLREQIAAWDKERLNYEARQELLPLRRERWVRRVAQKEKLVAAWQELVEKRRAAEIERQQRQAASERRNVNPLVQPLADANYELAAERDKLRPRSEAVQQRLQSFQPDPDELEKQFDRLKQRIESVGLTSTVGLYLRKTRASLPDLRQYRRDIKARQATMASAEFDRLLYEDEREALVHDTEARVEEILAGLPQSASAEERQAVETQAREQLRTRRAYLEDLNTDLNVYFNRLDALNEKEQRVVEQTERIGDYIDERILWIRSAEPLSPAVMERARDAASWLFGPDSWRELGHAVATDARSRWPLLVPAALLIGALLALRSWLRVRIRRLGENLSKSSQNTFGRTMEALVCTLARAGAWPALLAALALWVDVADPAGERAQAIVGGLYEAGVLLFLTQLTGTLCRPKGLAESHFRWPGPLLVTLRRNVAWFALIAVPGVFIVSSLEGQTNEGYSGGRLAFVATMIAAAVLIHRLARPKSGLVQAYIGRHRGGWVDRLRFLWHPLAVAIPLALAGLSVAGYHYTAVQLSTLLLDSAVLVLATSILYGLLLRWLVLAQQKLARADAKQRRAAAEEARAAAGTGVEAPPPVQEPQLDLSAINAQTRQLVRSLVLFTLLAGLWFIWADALPAIGFLREVELWARGGAAEGGAAMVSLADLLLGAVVVIATVLVSKNIPGLLEVSILQRLPLEPGGRYAITTLLRYAISIVGVGIAFSIVGLTWAKVQWIAAAITVGLGFGLQEIFANFVSGLIILFERPVRLGDVVTVGETSGTVTRIRIRATTITDWDRKELVIPNKEFVTGKIINWSLSDPTLRVSIPVGIAYGSDTAKATGLLLECARANPRSMADPPPQALFLGFGDSSLEFQLRVFIPSIDHFVPIKHELHDAIDRAFRKAGIEIAFPQRDIHVRTIKAGVPIDIRTASAPEEVTEPSAVSSRG